MTAAACKAAQCSGGDSSEGLRALDPAEAKVRRLTFHPEFCTAIGNQYYFGGDDGRKMFGAWIEALEQHPMTPQGIDTVNGIIDILTEL